MKIFDGLEKFAAHLFKVIMAQELLAKKALEQCCKIVQKEAKREIGHLQPEVGPFQDWAELADWTKEDKERQNYVFNSDYNPLLRKGELRDSISYRVGFHEAIVGSTSPIMIYHEFGTYRIPPRPVIGPAVYKNKEKIKSLIGMAFVSGFFLDSTNSPHIIHSSLGYDMEI